MLSDAYITQGDDAGAELMLQTIIDGKQKQEYVDEANAKLAQIKAKKNARINSETQPKEMKIEFKTENQDKDLFDQLLDAQKELPKVEEKKDN